MPFSLLPGMNDFNYHIIIYLLQSDNYTYIIWKLYCWWFCCYDWFKLQCWGSCNFYSMHKCAMLFYIWVIHLVSFQMIPSTIWIKGRAKVYFEQLWLFTKQKISNFLLKTFQLVCVLQVCKISSLYDRYQLRYEKRKTRLKCPGNFQPALGATCW